MIYNIISGQWKGLPIVICDDKKIKTTSLIIKKVIFNWIKLKEESNCLDLFSGSGCLGFEIASRFNCNVTLIEKKFFLYNLIKKNLKKFLYNKIKVYNISALNFLNKIKKKYVYDLIFLDLPFIDIKKTFFYIKLVLKVLNFNGKILLETLINYNIIINYFKNEFILLNFKKIKKVNLYLFKVNWI